MLLYLFIILYHCLCQVLGFKQACILTNDVTGITLQVYNIHVIIRIQIMLLKSLICRASYLNVNIRPIRIVVRALITFMYIFKKKMFTVHVY